MAVEIIALSVHRTGPGSNSQPLDLHSAVIHVSAVKHVTDCAMWPGLGLIWVQTQLAKVISI